MRVRNRQVAEDWEVLLRTRRDVCIRLWDHVASEPLTPVGSRYTPLRGNQRCVEFEGEALPQWQWEVDNNARVKIGVGRDFAVVVAVSFGPPRRTSSASGPTAMPRSGHWPRRVRGAAAGVGEASEAR